MQFLSKETYNHILRPIGYDRIEKHVKQGAPVRSAAEQFTIQRDASRFESNLIYIPTPHILNSHSYTMDMIPDAVFIPIIYYAEYTALLHEIVRFIGFMLKNNYFVHSFDLLYDKSQRRFAIVDFSECGFIQGTAVRFPNDENTYSIDEADAKYGIRIPERGLYDA
jgi:hypothetical protein